MRATLAYVGHGKTIHLIVDGTPACGVKGGSLTPAEGALSRVSCKRCVPAQLRLVAEAFELATEMDKEWNRAWALAEITRLTAGKGAPTARQRRAIRRDQARRLRATAAQTRAVARAARVKRNGTPATARTLLVAAGLPDDIAKRYAGAFSKGVEATLPKVSKRIPTGRRSKRVQVAVYTHAEFADRLATYRPKNAEHAALFALAG
jgi:hypothetical protein